MAKPNKLKTKAKASNTKALKPSKSKPKPLAARAKPSKEAKVPTSKIAAKIEKPLKQKPSKQNGAPASNRPEPKPDAKMNPFLKKQKERLLQLRDGMLDSMMGVAKDNLRSRAEGSEASAFGMHQADAGSDAYDRDFALSLLSQEQDALYEIDEALKRIDAGTYGVCEMSGKPIPHARLEAIPFARFTVECQSQLEKQNKLSRTRVPVTSLFGLTDDEGGDTEEDEPQVESKE